MHILYKEYFFPLVFKTKGFILTAAFFDTWTFKMHTVNTLFCVKHIPFVLILMGCLHGQVKSIAVDVFLEMALRSF